MELLLARRCAAGFCSAVGQFLGVSGRCRQDMRPYEHVFWYRLLVLRWAHFGAPGAAYALQGPRAVTCRPFYGVTRRHLGLSRAPHSTFQCKSQLPRA